MTVKILGVLAILALAKNCHRADFETPQPEGAKNLKSIPARLHGQYINLQDSSRLEITGKAILQYKTESHTMSNSELDSADWEDIKGDTSFCEKGYCIDIELGVDSISFSVNSIDTLIYIPGKGVMRKYKNYYFLNRELSNATWVVKKLELNKNELTLSSTFMQEDLDSLRKQLKTSDSTSIFRPTRSQFKQFVKEGGFRNKEKFRKE